MERALDVALLSSARQPVGLWFGSKGLHHRCLCDADSLSYFLLVCAGDVSRLVPFVSTQGSLGRSLRVAARRAVCINGKRGFALSRLGACAAACSRVDLANLCLPSYPILTEAASRPR